jgi:hypothetical protein
MESVEKPAQKPSENALSGVITYFLFSFPEKAGKSFGGVLDFSTFL